MNLSSVSAMMSISASIAPPLNNGDTAGKVNLGRSVGCNFTNATSAWAARLYFGAADQTATITLGQGLIESSLAGVRQEEATTIIATSGCTAAGNLALTITGAGITGSPLTVLVALTPSAHPTDEAIAAACAAKLNATTAVAALWKFYNVQSTFRCARIFPNANDATFNIAIPAGLGVTAAATSNNTTPGVGGVIIDRIAADGTDVFSEYLFEGDKVLAALMSVPPESPYGVKTNFVSGNGAFLGNILPRCSHQMMGSAGAAIPGDVQITPFGQNAILDIILISGD